MSTEAERNPTLKEQLSEKIYGTKYTIRLTDGQRRFLNELVAIILADRKSHVIAVLDRIKTPDYTDHSCTEEDCEDCLRVDTFEFRDKQWRTAIQKERERNEES